ncbi:MAG: peptide-methionine (R)-S-oxide reductase MsrB [Methyloligellaceae bacterium]
MINRRNLIFATSAVLGASAVSGTLSFSGAALGSKSGKVFEITKTEDEWKSILSPDQFAVLRKHATERAGTSPLLKEKREGIYACAGCKLPLYKSEHKYDSKTGWPSFTQAIENALGTKEDNTLFITRTEAHCRRCGGHLGHIFEDGPKPLGKRHCINGLAMVFEPKA